MTETDIILFYFISEKVDKPLNIEEKKSEQQVILEDHRVSYSAITGNISNQKAGRAERKVTQDYGKIDKLFINEI